eukprot:959864-Pleurochrysis_carterae.AAC.1
MPPAPKEKEEHHPMDRVIWYGRTRNTDPYPQDGLTGQGEARRRCPHVPTWNTGADAQKLDLQRGASVLYCYGWVHRRQANQQAMSG